MNYLQKIYEVIIDTQLDEFEGDSYIPVRFRAHMQRERVFNLRDVFEWYPDRTSLLRVEGIGRKSIADFVSALEDLE